MIVLIADRLPAGLSWQVEQRDARTCVVPFGDIADALAGALDILDATSREPQQPRIAIHAGDPRTEGVTTRCMRLRDIAPPGCVLVSRAARELAQPGVAERIELVDLGAVRLRDLSRPERVYQLHDARVPCERPELRSLDAVPNNLPVHVSTFVGRETECSTIAELLGKHRLVTLTGAGGAGKTRLGLQVAAELSAAYGDGVWCVDLAKLSDGALVPNAVAATLGIKEAMGQPIAATAVEHLREKSMLLVLDNCEHVSVACASLVDALLHACPSVTIVATSREPLGLTGEVQWRVPSLLEREAVQLFAERSRRVRPTFQLTDETAPVVAAICARLDGIPLAIELAAARTRMMTPQEIIEGLSDRFRLLSGTSRTAPPRHQTLRASVDWSHALLGEREQIVLRRLGVFAGGFTLAAACEVCASSEILREDILDIVASLVDRSLVQVGEEAPTSRYRLLETIRQHANERLAEAGDETAVRGRHAETFVALVERAAIEMEGAGLVEWLAVLDIEHDNVRAAFDWSLQVRPAQSLHIAAALWQFWLARGHFTEGRRRVEAALAATGDTDQRAAAMARVGVGQLMINQGDLEATTRFAEQALVIARELGDAKLAGRALDTLGYAAAFLDPRRAAPLFEESLQLSRAADDGVFVVDAYNGLGIARFLGGEYPAATEALEEAVTCARSLGNASMLAIGLGVLGYTRALQGRLTRARAHLCDGLVAARAVRDGAFTAQALYGLGLVDALGGKHEAAAGQLAESVALARETSPLMLAFALLTDGFARYIRDDLDGAIGQLEASLALSRELGLVWVGACSLALLGNGARLRGDVERARVVIEEALATTKAAGIRAELAIDAAARLARVVDEPERAEALHHEAIAAALAAESVLVVPAQLEALAGLAAVGGSMREAARLFGAAEAAREAHGLVRYVVDRAPCAADIEPVRGDAELGAAWQEGRKMSLDEAIAYASRGRGERKRPQFGWASLTPTELEVIRHVSAGLTNPQIASRLFISRSTVKVHLAHIFTKLDVSTRAELAALATRRGLTAK